jgi:hypothetical protein
MSARNLVKGANATRCFRVTSPTLIGWKSFEVADIASLLNEVDLEESRGIVVKVYMWNCGFRSCSSTLDYS